MKRLFSILAIIVFILALTPVFKKIYHKKGKARDSSNQVLYPYRVITASDSNRQLIAYELFENDNDNDYYTFGYTRCFGAILKSIDPARDDYKMYCRAIIADVVKMAGTDAIIVTIYDDYESFELSELRPVHDLSALNEAEQSEVSFQDKSSYVNKHFIACYYGHDHGHDNEVSSGYLFFYPQANNHYHETENYQPEYSGEADTRK